MDDWFCSALQKSSNWFYGGASATDHELEPLHLCYGQEQERSSFCAAASTLANFCGTSSNNISSLSAAAAVNPATAALFQCDHGNNVCEFGSCCCFASTNVLNLFGSSETTLVRSSVRCSWWLKRSQDASEGGRIRASVITVPAQVRIIRSAERQKQSDNGSSSSFSSTTFRKVLVWASGEDKGGFQEAFESSVLLPWAHRKLCECLMTSSNSSSPATRGSWIDLRVLCQQMASSSSSTSTPQISVPFCDLNSAEDLARSIVDVLVTSNETATFLGDTDGGGIDEVGDSHNRFLLQLKRVEFDETNNSSSRSGSFSSSWLVRPSCSWAAPVLLPSRPQQTSCFERSAAFCAARLYFLLRGADLLRAASILQRALLLDAVRGRCFMSAAAQELLCESFGFVVDAALLAMGAASSESQRASLEDSSRESLLSFSNAAAVVPVAFYEQHGLNGRVSGGRVLGFASSTSSKKRGGGNSAAAAAASATSMPLIASVSEVRKLSVQQAKAMMPPSQGHQPLCCRCCGLVRCPTTTAAKKGFCPIPGLVAWLLPTGLGGGSRTTAQQQHTMAAEVAVEFEQRRQRREALRKQHEQQLLKFSAAAAVAPPATINQQRRQQKPPPGFMQEREELMVISLDDDDDDDDAEAGQEKKQSDEHDDDDEPQEERRRIVQEQQPFRQPRPPQAVRRQRAEAPRSRAESNPVATRRIVDFLYRVSTHIQQQQQQPQRGDENDDCACWWRTDLQELFRILLCDSDSTLDILGILCSQDDVAKSADESLALFPKGGAELVKRLLDCVERQPSAVGQEEDDDNNTAHARRELVAQFIDALQDSQAQAALDVAVKSAVRDEERQRVGSISLITVRNERFV